jgi:hypothetical protein
MIARVAKDVRYPENTDLLSKIFNQNAGIHIRHSGAHFRKNEIFATKAGIAIPESKKHHMGQWCTRL